jgi:hypothetical protein
MGLLMRNINLRERRRKLKRKVFILKVNTMHWVRDQSRFTMIKDQIQQAYLFSFKETSALMNSWIILKDCNRITQPPIISIISRYQMVSVTLTVSLRSSPANKPMQQGISQTWNNNMNNWAIWPVKAMGSHYEETHL